MNNIKDIWELIGDDKEKLEETIIESAKSSVDLNNRVANYVIQSGGKRIRPLVLLLLARTQNYSGDLHFKLASAVEFIHTATLLHDDVVDNSDLRRNKKTANNLFGNSTAVLVGDFLYSRSFQIISHDLNAVKIMADATNELAMGEVIQLTNIDKIDLTEDEYFRVIHLKTAVLFGAACQFSGVITKMDKEQYKKLKLYGESLGRAFQIADDILDYIGKVENIGKNMGDDLAEGKITLPIIHCMKNAKANDKVRLRDILKQKDKEAVHEVVKILDKYGSIEYTKSQAYYQADKAKENISFLPNSIYKDALMTIPDLAVRRSN